VVVIRLKQLVYPLYGRGRDTVARISRDNPIEMVDRLCLQPGELAMYVAYGGRDQFNITAQVDSFLYRARQRGLAVAVSFDPQGRHSWRLARRLLPGILAWLGPLLAPYAPGR
jgi:S-formylglutathione hydrolase FrmB